jgi:hypothetical protein
MVGFRADLAFPPTKPQAASRKPFSKLLQLCQGLNPENNAFLTIFFKNFRSFLEFLFSFIFLIKKEKFLFCKNPAGPFRETRRFLYFYANLGFLIPCFLRLERSFP